MFPDHTNRLARSQKKLGMGNPLYHSGTTGRQPERGSVGGLAAGISCWCAHQAFLSVLCAEKGKSELLATVLRRSASRRSVPTRFLVEMECVSWMSLLTHRGLDERLGTG